jgi:hypothetical protein
VTRLPVALAATLHDPTAALADDVAAAIPTLQALYAAVRVTTSPPTSPRMVALLRDADMYAGTPRANRRGPLYRLAVRAAAATRAPSVHYLDFDRAVHWLRVAPRELAAVLRLARRRGSLVIGRTPAAHASHHRPLWATELVASTLIATALEIPGRFDLLVPSFVLPAAAARELVRRSRARDEDVYGEWAALVTASATPLGYVECHGLDWETPDRFRRAVRRIGRPAWRRRQETPAEWALRTAMAQAIVAGFTRVHARRRGRLELVRHPPRSVR